MQHGIRQSITALTRTRRIALAIALSLALALSCVPMVSSAAVPPVAGQVTVEGTGTGIAGVRVILYDGLGTIKGQTTTDASGHYYFGSVSAGALYAVSVVGARGYGDHVPALGDYQEYAGSPLTLNVALASIGYVASGTITNAETGDPVAGVLADLWTWTSGGVYELIASATTGSDGTYRIYDRDGLLASGEMCAVDVTASGYESCFGDSDHLTRYSGSPLPFNATLVPIHTINVQENGVGVTFDRFVPGSSAAFSGGNYLYGRWANTELQIRFNGTSIAWIGSRQPSYGKADVYLDNIKVATVDCYAPTAEAVTSATLWDSLDLGELADGPHTLRIRLTGAKNPASSGYVVVVDKFEVTAPVPAQEGVRVNESSGTFTGSWIAASSTTYVGGGYRYSRWAGAKISYTFTGTKIAWIGPRTGSYGRADVYIDGVKRATVSQYGTLGWRYRVWESGTLSRGVHTIEIRVLGTKESASSGTIVVVDGFDVKR